MTIKLDAEIDTTDQLKSADPGQLGIQPQLAAQETIIYPKSAVVIATTALLAAGTIEVIPPVTPLTPIVRVSGSFRTGSKAGKSLNT